MTPCGANNDCKAMVCMNCKTDNDMIADSSMGAMEQGTYKCVICKEKEYKNAIIFELEDLYCNTWGIVNEDTVEAVFENVLFKNIEEGLI